MTTVAKQLTQDQQDKAFDAAIGWVQASVLRAIATRGLPLLLAWGVFNGGLAKLQDAIGLDLPKEVVAGYVITMLSGGVVALGAWVLNHGRGAERILVAIVSAAQSAMTLGTALRPRGAEGVTVEVSTRAPLADDDEAFIGERAGSPPAVPGPGVSGA